MRIPRAPEPNRPDMVFAADVLDALYVQHTRTHYFLLIFVRKAEERMQNERQDRNGTIKKQENRPSKTYALLR